MSRTSPQTDRPTVQPPPAASAILGIGSYLPGDLLTNPRLEQLVETSDTWIMERTGIRTRHMVGEGQTSADMAAIAARIALEQAGNPHIDCLLVATCSPDTLIPSTACLVQRQLGMPGIAALDINAACSGFVYGLTLADSMVRSGTAGHVLVVCTEAMSRLIDYGDRSTCVLFGDGAGAVVVGPAGATGAIRRIRWAADGGEADYIFYGPAQESAETPDRLRMKGRGTFRSAVERLCQVAQELCGDAGWKPAEVDWFVPHQANLRIIEAAAKRLGVGMDHVMTNVEEVGNTSAASIPLALSQYAREGRLQPGQRVVCVAFGAGTTWGGVALEWARPSA